MDMGSFGMARTLPRSTDSALKIGGSEYRVRVSFTSSSVDRWPASFWLN